MVSKLVGPYNIVEKIGFGGMGIVYKAIHNKLEQVVAIKVLSPQFSCNQEMKTKFLQEAKIQAKLSHPNVVNIMNYMEDEDETYLIMEYIEGETLEQLLQRETKLPLEKAIHISKGILSALKYMHSKGLVHRDIKPSNIMFNKSGEVKVTDFGITKLIGEDKNTKSGLVGSYTYMSPEQILGDEVGIASDLYSFGITLYRMVTGQVPFKGNTEYAIMKGHLESPRIPPWIINPEMPRRFGKLIQKIISRNIKDRFQKADDILEALDNYNDTTYFLNNVEFNYKKKLGEFVSTLSAGAGRLNIRLLVPAILIASVLAVTISFDKDELPQFDGNNFAEDSSLELWDFAGSDNYYDVSWENIVSSLDSYLYGNDEGNNKKIIRKKRKNNFVKNETPENQTFYPPQKYRYTNNDFEEEKGGLKNTLKRTKILPIQ